MGEDSPPRHHQLQKEQQERFGMTRSSQRGFLSWVDLQILCPTLQNACPKNRGVKQMKNL